jgi:hypothetical protein
MLSPEELYLTYTKEPCYKDLTDVKSRGTPYDLPRLIRFLRHLKYPCLKGAPYVNVEASQDNPLGIKGTGSGKLGIPYKFLNKIDAEAFTEIQPSINSGTSHGIRNACDITRACNIENEKKYIDWEARMATEYLEHFAGNSLPDCLMMLGPDLVSEEVAQNEQIPGCSYTRNNVTYQFDCIANPKFGAVGAEFSCKIQTGETQPKCTSCEPCIQDEFGNNINAGSACCQAKTCVERLEMCCGAPETNRLYFSYIQQEAKSRLDLETIIDLKLKTDIKLDILKHLGILKRLSYGGYGNFIDNSGPNFYACNDDIFLKHFQNLNNYNYITDTAKLPTDENYASPPIERFKTISFIGEDENIRMSRVKDLLFNGYGVILMTNVGFPNFRDSSGLSYPDRIWYHTFSIIGYDDTLIEYPECVYLLANSWGSWNSGGQPSWGPIPTGSFLITESHLKGMTKFNYSPSFWGCRTRFCPDSIAAAALDIGLNISSDAIYASANLQSLLAISGYTASEALIIKLTNAINNNSNAGACQDPIIKSRYGGCSTNPPDGTCCGGSDNCVPFDCSNYQSAFGLLFGLSTSIGFPKRNFDYKQFYPINNYSKIDNTTDLYLNE